MSTVPAALDALVATAVAVMPGVRVEDGPWINRPEAPDVIAIGWTPDEGEAVEFDEQPAGLDASQESYDVVCLASSWSGDLSMSARRARVDALVETLRGELRRDPTLGGVVARAVLTTLALNQYQTGQGCEATEMFTVHIDAFRND